MSLIVSDRVVETSTSTGSGDIALAGAVTGYRRFSAKMAVGDTCYYTIEGVDNNGLPTGEWETGLGTYSALNTLTRTTVKDSSNAGAAVTFSAGTKRVFLNMIAAVAGGIPWYWKPPKAADFTLSNGGGATNMILTDDELTGLVLEPNTFAAASSLSHAFALQTLADKNADWTMTARIDGNANGDFEYNGFGLCLYDSISARFVAYYFQRTYSNLGALAVCNWVNASTFSSDQATARSKYNFLRVVHSGGNYTYQFSVAGKRWFTLLTTTNTSWTTNKADKVGFVMGSARNTNIFWQYNCQHFSIV